MKVMYYDNILISDLMSDEHLEHHGVLGQKWGIRRYQSYSTVPRGSGKAGKETGLAKKKSRLEAKKASNSAKLAKAKAKQESPEAKARRAKIDEYTGKANKVNSSIITRRADYKLARGKDTGTLGDIQLRKRAYYESKASKYLAEEAKLNAKVAKLEARDLRLNKRIDKLDKKIRLKPVKDLYKDVNKELDDAMRSTSRDRLKFKISDAEYQRANREYNAARKANKELYKVDKAKIYQPDAYYESYKNTVDGLKKQGANVDDYFVSKVDRRGRVKTMTYNPKRR